MFTELFRKRGGSDSCQSRKTFATVEGSKKAFHYTLVKRLITVSWENIGNIGRIVAVVVACLARPPLRHFCLVLKSYLHLSQPIK